MTDSTGLQHPFGIEAVRWSPGTGSELLVRVTGRWRRRRPATTVAAVLVIETEHQPYRFTALPDPPSLRGAQPGRWLVRFRIPAALAPYLDGRSALMLGSVSIRLPPAVADPGEPGVPDGAGPIVVTDRRKRHAELADADVRRAPAEPDVAGREAKALLDWLELELSQARREAERLRTELARAERKRREAEQLAHAEKVMRLELRRDHAARIRRHQADARAAHGLFEAAQIHARKLAREIEALRRESVEAPEHPGHLTWARPGRPARFGSSSTGMTPRQRALAAELALARASPVAPFASVIAPSREPPGLRLERVMASVWNRQPGGREPRVALVMDAIEGIGHQLDAVRAVVALLVPATTATPSRAEDRPERFSAVHSHGPDQPAGAVAPDRLAAALERLREQSPPLESEAAAARENPGAQGDTAAAPRQDPAPDHAPPARWLLPALKRMLREDPAVVGSIVIHLLPAQRLVAAGPVRYDIALSGQGCRSVTVTGDELCLEVLSAPRPLDAVDFRIEGDLAGLGRLLVYGSLRRRLSRRVARVRGQRRALPALDRLVREPIALVELYAAGVRLDPELALALIAHVVDPAWTAGHRFTIGHEAPGGGERVYLLIRDGARPRVSRDPPLGPVTSTIRCPGEELLAVLTGGSAAAVSVRGARRPVALLSEWISRAERDS